MAKVSRGSDDYRSDVLWAGRALTIRAMRDGEQVPALEWLRALERDDVERFHATAAVLDTSMYSGRPHGHLVVTVQRSACDLRLFRVTQRGATPPHLRLIHTMQDNVMWAAHGARSDRDVPEETELAIAERIATRWLSA